MVECANCIHYFVCKTLKGKLKGYYAETCIAYLNREDFVTVVRCKDCKHYNEQKNHCDHPNDDWIEMEADDFCSYGERKDNAEK